MFIEEMIEEVITCVCGNTWVWYMDAIDHRREIEANGYPITRSQCPLCVEIEGVPV